MPEVRPASTSASTDVPGVPLARVRDHRLAGDGVVYSYAILHHPQNPAFEYPVLAALIDLDEGVRVLSNLVEVDPSDITIGMPVTVDFRPTRPRCRGPSLQAQGQGR